MCDKSHICDQSVASATLSMSQGFKTNDKGEKVGFNTMVYSESEVTYGRAQAPSLLLPFTIHM